MAKKGRKEKESQIRGCLNSKTLDLAQLRSLSLTSHGYINSELRRKVWPRLLDLSEDTPVPVFDREKLITHRDYNQVVLDVNRSVKRFPKAMKEVHRTVLQEQLTMLVMKVLVNNTDLHYYQGFHDVCVTFLLILGTKLGFIVVNHLSQNHLRDFMEADMQTTRSMLNYLYPLLNRADPELESYMQKAELGTIFALSWLITWYSHALEDENEVVRLYDFFLASHPLMPIYLAVAIVIHRREEIFNTECEMCFIHVLLSKVPHQLPYETLIHKASTLYKEYPPTDLADDAEFQYEKSKAMKSYAKFEKRHGLPVLTKTNNCTQLDKKKQESSSHYAGAVLKVTMWTFTAALGAAIIALQYAASNNVLS